MKKLLIGTLVLAITSATVAFAGTCEDGTGNPRMCAALIHDLYKKAKISDFPTSDEIREMKCYRKNFSHTGGGYAQWNPEAYDAKLKFKHFEVSADHTQLQKNVTYLDSGNRFWHEIETEAVNYIELGGFTYSLHSYWGVTTLRVLKYKDQYIVSHSLTENAYGGTLDRYDVCIEKN